MISKVPSDECRQCFGKGGYSDPESIDQWYWCDNCDAAEEYCARKKKHRKTDIQKAVDNLRAMIGNLNDEERLAVLNDVTEGYCKHCGREGVCYPCNAE